MGEEEIYQFLLKRLESLAQSKGKSFSKTIEIDFFELGLVDSVEFLKLIADVEKAFHITVNFDDASPASFHLLRPLAQQCAKFL